MAELVALLRPDALSRFAGRSSQPSALAGSGSRQARPSSERPALRPSAYRSNAPLELKGVEHG
jgi:hypothetical protein